jgi:NAD-specific glutamate dehydrogenase
VSSLRLRHTNGREFWIHDFAFTAAEGLDLDIQQLNDTLQDAFVHIVRGDAENDAFNRLVLTAGLPWRDVALLRAYARYLKQIRLGFDLGYIASTLNNHTDIARELTRLFKTRFYLARKLARPGRQAAASGTGDPDGTGRRSGAQRRPHPASLPGPDQGHPAHQLLPDRRQRPEQVVLQLQVQPAR